MDRSRRLLYRKVNIIDDNTFTTKGKTRMDTKDNSKVQETEDESNMIDTEGNTNMTDPQDNKNVTEVALALVEATIAAAVQFVKESINPIKNIKWITHGEFTAERGRRQIEKFVSKWEYQSRWVHYTDFIEREDLIHSFRYIYCVRWSVPTALKPMPRVSATAFFTIKFNKNKPPDMPVDVSYVFEGQALVQRPGMIRFREKWLRDIIEAKHILMESLPF